jgi:hypothetical protein
LEGRALASPRCGTAAIPRSKEQPIAGGIAFIAIIALAASRFVLPDGVIATGDTPMQLLEGSPAAVFPWTIRGKFFALRHGYDDALAWMAANRAPAAAIRIVKAGVPAASTKDPDFNAAVSAFVGSASTASVFFRLLSDNVVNVVPLRTRVMLTLSPGIGVAAGEGAAKPVQAVDWITVVVPALKAQATEAFTDEFWSSLSAAAQAQFHRDLVAAVGRAVDGVFLDVITHTATPTNISAGPTAANAWTDLRTALNSVSTTGASRLVWVMGPTVANRAAALDAAGIPVFPAMSPTGGEMANLPAIVSGGCPAGELHLIDGTGLAAGTDTIIPRTTIEADILLNTSPTMSSSTPAAAALTSMFQTNSVGLQLDVIFGATTLRDTANHITTGVAWGS